MTDEEFAQWGSKEDDIRKAEMEDVKSASDLKSAQAACKNRRNSVGLSAGQATRAVVVGQQIKRGESLSFAMRRK